MVTRVLVLSVNDWTFEEKKGTTLYYLPSTPKADASKRGFFPVKQSVNQDLASKIKSNPLPAYYDMTCEFGGSVGGKMDLVITDFKMIKEIDLFGLAK